MIIIITIKAAYYYHHHITVVTVVRIGVDRDSYNPLYLPTMVSTNELRHR